VYTPFISKVPTPFTQFPLMHSAIATVFHIKDIKVINKNFLIPQTYPIPTANAIIIDDNEI
jgi:hypothetical protein